MILDRLGRAFALSLLLGACNPAANGLGSDSGVLGRPTPMDPPPTTGLTATDGPPGPPMGTGSGSASSGAADDADATTEDGATSDEEPTSTTGDADASTGEPLPPPQSLPEHSCEEEGTITASLDPTPAGVWFINGSDAVRRIYWLDWDGNREFLDEVKPGGWSGWFAFVDDPFLIADENDQCITIFVMVAGDHEIKLY